MNPSAGTFFWTAPSPQNICLPHAPTSFVKCIYHIAGVLGLSAF